GGQVLCPGPGHSAKDRSLAVRVTQTGEIIVFSFAGDDWRPCRKHVFARLGLCGQGTPAWPSARALPSRPDTFALATRIWQETIDVCGTPGQRYLIEERKLAIGGEDFGHVLRFHPRCPFKVDDVLEYAPALIGLMRDVITDEAKAIQRIRLTADGKSACRMMLGPSTNCAVKLDPDEHVHSGLIICEG